MKAQSSTSMNLELDADLRRPERLAYHRLHGSGDLVREIHDLKATPMGQAESIETLYQWLFVPISLWPIDIDGLLRQLIKALRSKTRLQKEFSLLPDLLPPIPNNKACSAATQHEHPVQHGSYETLSEAQHKFDAAEKKLARNPAFKASWQAIKSHSMSISFAIASRGKEHARRLVVPLEIARRSLSCGV